MILLKKQKYEAGEYFYFIHDELKVLADPFDDELSRETAVEMIKDVDLYFHPQQDFV